MAGDWIKMRGNLWDDPRVARLCDLTEASEGPVIGALYWLWSTADQHTEDGCMPGLTLRQIDRKTGLPGFAEALCQIGWMHDSPDGVVIVKFEEHNGTSAKRRCADAQRKATGRAVSACDADKGRTDNGTGAEEKRRAAELEEEKRKSKEKGAIAPLSTASPSTDSDEDDQQDDRSEVEVEAELELAAKVAGVPGCPHDEILSLFAYRCSMLPQPRAEVWGGARKRHLAARWRWLLTAKRKGARAGERFATTTTEGLEWFGRYFDVVADAPHLVGENDRGWRATLEWIVKEENFAKVFSGNYTKKDTP